MLGKSTYAGALIILLVSLSSALAQNSDDTLEDVDAASTSPIVGFWKQDRDSVYLHITERNGALFAEVVRSDWSPGSVGTNMFENLKATDDTTWSGTASVDGAQKSVKLSLKRNGQLVSTYKPGPRQRRKWVRTEPIEKRY